jgi:hypothetical protein
MFRVRREGIHRAHTASIAPLALDVIDAITPSMSTLLAQGGHN